MTDYTLEGPRWGTGATGTAGGTVTWAVDGTVPGSFLPVIQAAFADWSSHADIAFKQVASTAGADIDFSDSFIDGADDVLAQPRSPRIGRLTRLAAARQAGRLAGDVLLGQQLSSPVPPPRPPS